MSDSDDGTGRNPLYDLLPAVFRAADIGQGFPLLALAQVLRSTDLTLQTGIDALYDSWFIQTCPLSLVVQIAALLGVALPTPVRPEHRALVADALAVRRRKGTAAALPVLLRGATNWYALVLDAGGAVPPAAWPLRVPEPFGMEPATPGDPASVQLLAWRLPVFALEGVTPYRGYLNPLGLPQPVWNVAGTPLPMGVPPVTALPAAVTMAMLADDLARFIGTWPSGPGSPADSLLYGPGRGLLLRQQAAANGPWSDLPPSAIRAVRLGPEDQPPPDYPVFLSGEIDQKKIKTEKRQVQATLGDATAQLTYGLDATKSGTDDLAEALNKAFQALKLSDITPPEAATPAMLATLQASMAAACGQQLAVVPGDGSFTVFTFDQDHSDPDDGTGDDPLQLMTPSASPGLALRTLPLDQALLTRLTALPAGGTLNFNDAGRRSYAVTIPLAAAKPVTIATVAAALQKALQSGQPKATVVICGDRLAIVPATITTDGSTWTADPQNLPPMAALAWSLGLTRAIVLNPEDGSLAMPTVGAPSGSIQASYGYAAVAPIGGAPWTRPMLAPPPGAVSYPITGTQDVVNELNQWKHAKPASAVFTLAGSGTFRFSGPAETIALAAGQSLLIRASQRQRPLVTIAPSQGMDAMTLQGPADLTGAPGQFRFDGLLLQGEFAIGDGLQAVALADTTIYPQPKKPALARKAGDTGPQQLDLVIARCILGSLDGTGLTGTLSITDSILSALPAPALDQPVIDKFDDTVPVTLGRSTLLGSVAVAGTLTATDTLFAGALTASGTVDLSHCYVIDLLAGLGDRALAAADGSSSAALVARCPACNGVTGIRLQRCYVRALSLGPAELTGCRCDDPPGSEVRSCEGCAVPGCEATCPLKGAGRLWRFLASPPRFYQDNLYPRANFARLADDNPPELLAGAEDQGEIGAFNRAAMPARARQFQAALDGALPFGSTADVEYLS